MGALGMVEEIDRPEPPPCWRGIEIIPFPLGLPLRPGSTADGGDQTPPGYVHAWTGPDRSRVRTREGIGQETQEGAWQGQRGVPGRWVVVSPVGRPGGRGGVVAPSPGLRNRSPGWVGLATGRVVESGGGVDGGNCRAVAK
jgi:hypothetical protein